MTPKLVQLLLAVGASGALVLLLKATVIAGLGLVGAELARGRSAALRHLIVAATLAALVLLPAASRVIPALRIGVPVARQLEAVPAVSLPSRTAVAIPMAGTAAAFTPPTAAAWLHRLSFSELAFSTWALGAAAFLLPLLLGFGEVRRLGQAARGWREGQMRLEVLAPGAAARVMLHAGEAGPLTYGVLRPVIVLPQAARQWPAADLERALTHELEHTRRWDWLTYCGGRVVCALYWFHPLVWMLQRRLRVEAERACDDAVLRQADAVAYADQLVGYAWQRTGAARTPLLALASRTDLATRIHAMLDTAQRRERARRGTAAIACGASLLLVFALAPLQVTAARGQQPARRFDAVSIRRAAPNLKVLGRIVDPERLVYPNATLYAMALDAYGLNAWQLTGGPGWLNRDRFALNAETTHPADKAEMMRMLRTVLTERFGLKLQTSSRTGNVYRLQVARGGTKLSEKPLSASAYSIFPNLPVFHMADGSVVPLITARYYRYVTAGNGKKSTTVDRALLGRQATAGELVQGLSNLIKAPVSDVTGLSGRYNFVMRFAEEAGGAYADVSTLPGAVKQQLGLQLIKSKGSYPVYTVVGAREPSGN